MSSLSSSLNLINYSSNYFNIYLNNSNILYFSNINTYLNTNLIINNNLVVNTITVSNNLKASSILYNNTELSNLLGSSSSSSSTNISSNIIYSNITATQNFYGDAMYLNNYNFNNQLNINFPPYNNFYSSCNIYSNLIIGSGLYIISSSSFISSNSNFLAFDNNLNNSWITSNFYTSNSIIPSNYIGSCNTIITTNINNSNISLPGEWIQLYYEKKFAANNLTLYSNSNRSFPYNFSIVSSYDNSNWNLLGLYSNVILNSNNSNNFNINNNTAYNYYRIIINNTSNSSNSLINEIIFKGTQNTNYVNYDDFYSINYNTTVKRIPLTYAYSTNVITSISLESFAFLNEIACFPILPYKQTINQFIYSSNNFVYTIYSSTSTGANLKENIFNNNYVNTNFATWGLSQYTAGNYSGNSYIGLNDSESSLYKGDWIIIKFASKIILVSYNIYQNNIIANSPLQWKCFASNNGINYIEIADASQNINAIYTTGVFKKKLNNLYFPYLYYAWVFTKINGGTQLQITELDIYAKDDLSYALNKLDIDNYGNITINSNATLAFQPYGSIFYTTINKQFIYTSLGGSHLFKADGGAAVFTIGNTGNAYIAADLYFQGTANIRDGTGWPRLTFIANSTTQINAGNSPDGISFNNFSASSTMMIIKTAGNIGMGTTNPNSPLHIHRNTVSTEVKIQLSDFTTGVNAGSAVIKNINQDLIIVNYQCNVNINISNLGSNINFSTQSNINFSNSQKQSMTINTIGNIGIGLTNPNAKLEVASGTASTGAITQYILGNSTTISTTSTASTDICSIFNSSIWSKSTVIVSSDIRIKNNINDINDDSALQKILNIKPKTYNYIDKFQRNSNIVYGFIAQQIRDIIPEAITLTTEFIPNIYSLCSNNSNTIIIPEIILSNNNININDEINIIDGDNYERNNYIITNINSNQITINENLNCSNCFVYGTKVNDFHTLNKEYIYTLNVCATQDLYKMI